MERHFARHLSWHSVHKKVECHFNPHSKMTGIFIVVHHGVPLQKAWPTQQMQTNTLLNSTHSACSTRPWTTAAAAGATSGSLNPGTDLLV